MDWLVWKQKVLGEHDYDITIASWKFDDATNLLSLFHSQSAKAWGNNFINLRNKSVDMLLSEINLEQDFFQNKLSEFQFSKIKLILLKDIPYKDHQKRYF